MAVRPVFEVLDRSPYYAEFPVEFPWHAGFAVSQKQKSITEIHNAYHRFKPDRKLLEVSSKSTAKEGTELSAFHLLIFVPSLKKSVPVECAFQAGKVFEHGGPYRDLLESSPRTAKKDERLKNSGKIIAFEFEGERFPTIPLTFFYDWLYMTALIQNPQKADLLLDYQAFTDVEFNPGKSISCQARTDAVFVSLHHLGLLDRITTKESYYELITGAYHSL